MSIIQFVILNLVVYLPFHLFEKAIGDFPKWMYEHKWLPYHMTHGHWMTANFYNIPSIFITLPYFTTLTYLIPVFL